jgi:hypothetical protein
MEAPMEYSIGAFFIGNMLQITKRKEKKITTTYTKTWYRVSSSIPLDREGLATIRHLGFLGSGQEWFIHNPSDRNINLHEYIVEDRLDLTEI